MLNGALKNFLTNIIITLFIYYILSHSLFVRHHKTTAVAIERRKQYFVFVSSRDFGNCLQSFLTDCRLIEVFRKKQVLIYIYKEDCSSQSLFLSKCIRIVLKVQSWNIEGMHRLRIPGIGSKEVNNSWAQRGYRK